MNEDYKKAVELGLTDFDRWEKGMCHHPKSERLIKFIAEHDFHDHGDYLEIKFGGDGDGDGGEHLMYLMDTFFEMLDKVEEMG